MLLLKEINAVMDVPTCNKTIKCDVFKDKNGAIEIAKATKIRPRDKHAATKHQHFRSHVQQGEFIIEKFDIEE